jgi:glycolate oxidase iron-sulfur subunit
MQTKLPPLLAESALGKKANDILRSCVHCGFCLATCPTYQLFGDELDSPRGRIYLIKSALEDNDFTTTSIKHLDRCLTCRACETTCPSGVEYGQLVDIGRLVVEQKRPLWQKVYRTSVRTILTTPALFNLAAPFFKQSTISSPELPASAESGKIILHTGCVQATLTPNTNHVTKNVLHKLGVSVTETAQSECCGAIDQHLAAPDAALDKIKHNLDQWTDLLASGYDQLISTASGCGVMIKDYPTLFESTDPYYQKALTVSNKTQDIAEFLSSQDLAALKVKDQRVSYHAPCTLQHGQKLPGLVEQLLSQLGYCLLPVTDSHLCCGSAGTYSIFEPETATLLRNNKVKNLSQPNIDLIVTSNIGCQMHLAKGTDIPVKHWIELLEC